MGNTKHSIEKDYMIIKKNLSKIGLSYSKEKTSIKKASEGFTFLGHKIIFNKEKEKLNFSIKNGQEEKALK